MKISAGNIVKGDRRALARAITLIESSRPDHRQQAQELLTRLMPHTGRALRLGITGVPGVGKSTFVEALGDEILSQNLQLAVLAVDPSSRLSGGSILGDKTRMGGLSRRQGAFIRPSPARETLGGVARHSYETLLLCEAAGFDVILTETVGVGQGETQVADMSDMFVFLLLPGSGDELQGIKRGITELADLVIVNKADGEQEAQAQATARDYETALHMLRPIVKDWPVPVMTVSALERTRIDKVWEVIQTFQDRMKQNGEIAKRREKQSLAWMCREISVRLMEEFKDSPHMRDQMSLWETRVRSGEVPASLAADRLLYRFFKRKS